MLVPVVVANHVESRWGHLPVSHAPYQYIPISRSLVHHYLSALSTARGGVLLLCHVALGVAIFIVVGSPWEHKPISNHVARNMLQGIE
jgi:hypothetical protein